MSEQLDSHEEELLQAALNNSFGSSSLPALPVVEPTPPPATAPAATEPAPAASEETTPGSSSSNPAEEAWKAEYEALQASWKKDSAEQRAQAEARRKKWEEIRAREAQERKERGEPEENVTGSGWVGVSNSASSTLPPSTSETTETSPVDARDLVSGEGQGGKTKEELEAILPGSAEPSPPESGSHDRHASEPESSNHEKWENVSSSVTSSYPSMSFPSDPHSPSSTHHPHLHPEHHDEHHLHHHPPHHHGHHDHAETTSPTFAVFDSRLSRKTRVLALLSSLAINLFLPFVNGVMLGFGEIFARNVVVGWFGWKVPGQRPGSAAASVGLGRSREKRP